jgi:ethanolamine ammonia-lyase small subunit
VAILFLMSRLTPDPWSSLRRFTSARIALGRAGGSLPTAELLDFALAHAAARDAVHSVLDIPSLIEDLKSIGLPVIVCKTQVPDHVTYLQRPDLGSRLDPASNDVLAGQAKEADLSIVISDGLSAIAARSHAANLLKELIPLLKVDGISLAPLVIAPLARVAVQDEVGHALGSRASLIVLGERPGLGCPDSLGAYLVFHPRPGNTNADRNCVSNIRPAGLPIPAAAATLRYLIGESIRRKISGIQLKDERSALPLPDRAAEHGRIE